MYFIIKKMNTKLTKRGILFSWEINTRVTSKKKKTNKFSIYRQLVSCAEVVTVVRNRSGHLLDFLALYQYDHVRTRALFTHPKA